VLLGIRLRDHAAHREAEQIERAKLECIDEFGDASGHALDRRWGGARGTGDPGVVDQDDRAFAGKAVGQQGSQ
jgi:hypothetical protein